MGDTQAQHKAYVFQGTSAGMSSVVGGGEKQQPSPSQTLPSPVHLIGDLVPPGIACVLRLVGIREIGGGARNRNSLRRYVIVCIFSTLVFSLQWTPVLMGLGHPFALSVAAPHLFLLLTMVKSSLSEMQIFRSEYVAHRLVESEQDRRKLRQWCANGAPMILGLLMWIPMFLIVCLPVMTHEDTEMLDRVFLWVSLILTPVAYLLIFVPVQSWSPLTEMHICKITSELNRICDSMLSILSDANLSPQEAADKLGSIDREDARKLRRELRVWGRQSSALLLLATHGVVLCLFTLFAPSDATKIRAEPGLAQAVRVWLAAWSILFYCPWAFAFLTEAATPAKRWRRFVQSVMRDASVQHRALVKFSGSGRALESWLNHNTICLRLFGFPIDETLVGKIAALGGSLVSVLVLVIARLTGYY